MLDEMSTTNPEQYKQFIDKNLKEGFSEMKETKEKEVQTKMVLPTPAFVLKIYGKLIRLP